MNVRETKVECSKCHKKIGLLVEVIGGTNHTISQSLTCMDCLPQTLKAAEGRKYNPAIIREIRQWMEEK